MILQVKNNAQYTQSITLHTGESKEVESGFALKINIGLDRRLTNFYASLVNYEFSVTALEATGQEMNSLQDAIQRLSTIRKVTDDNKVFKDRGVYPEKVIIPNEIPTEPRKPYNPLTLDKVIENTEIPKKVIQTEIPSNPILVDSKLGEVVQDLTPQLPDDYPDDPNAAAEVRRIEKEEEKLKSEHESSEDKYNALDELDDDVLKKILYEKFDESTKLRSKWKIINHIIELADDSGIDIYDIIEEYK